MLQSIETSKIGYTWLYDRFSLRNNTRGSRAIVGWIEAQKGCGIQGNTLPPDTISPYYYRIRL
jgi:hypothetical protein